MAEIRDYVKPTINATEFIDKVLIPFSNAYDNVLKSNYESTHFAEEINRFFGKLKRVQHTDWIPPTILFLAKHPSAAEKVRNFLSQLEKITLAMEGMRISLNERLERFARILLLIENNEDLYKTKSDFMLSEIDRQKIITSLSSQDLYGKRLVKPVLAKIEEQMNDGSIAIDYDILSIEHILPQTPTAEYWTSRFTTVDRIKLTDCIGNLSLITVRKNSQAKNSEFTSKIKVYFKADGKASNLAMVSKLAETHDWTPEQINARKTVQINYFLTAVGLEAVRDI